VKNAANMAHAAHIVARILKGRRIENVLGEDQLRIRRGKGKEIGMQWEC
jgi:hypothetical protein